MSGFTPLAERRRRILAVLGVLALLALVTTGILSPRPGPIAATGEGNSITAPDPRALSACPPRWRSPPQATPW